ncbi:myosin binding vezatin family protein [Schizosaccharomyces cryophilus OY26]|uniref:Myosin binding vezatin family protein n=1 Tax=Schizosaccharomyces cryophilus (strain OY26 / ATCC MYA-4695 / CBS 11777 / NBRC 106824 / NRRL Y48691) TaxID=653667 RepID=S9W147_SCHCR|nr:myosin binding vezatin family protein [Schizosaccharomyces cryophilus OY26]EPY52209.1 myosin binding vezatin family protein [Schizosaccharomyces cryophilus OY26]
MKESYHSLKNNFIRETTSDGTCVTAFWRYWSKALSKLHYFGCVSFSLVVNYAWPYVLESFQPNICEKERTLLYDNIQYIIYTSDLLVGDHKLHCQGNLNFGSSIPIPTPPSFSSKKLWYIFTYQSVLQISYCLGFYCVVSLLCKFIYLKPLKVVFFSYLLFSIAIIFCHFWVYYTRIASLDSIYRLTHALQAFEDVSNRVYTQICELGHPDYLLSSSGGLYHHTQVCQINRNQELLSRKVSDLFGKLLPSYQALLSRLYPFTAPFFLRDLLLLYKLPNCFTNTSTPFLPKHNSNPNLQRNSLYSLRKEAIEYNSHSNGSLLFLVKSYSDLTIISKQVLCCILSFSVHTFPQECTSWPTLCRNIDSFTSVIFENTQQLSSFSPSISETGAITSENELINHSPHNHLLDVNNLKKHLQNLHFAMLETHGNISVYLQENANTDSHEVALKEYDHFGFQLKGLLSEWEFYRDMLNYSPRKKE